jgi:O-antigen/teichoic acid export membrane protein
MKTDPEEDKNKAEPVLARAAASFKWSALTEIISKAFSPLVLVVLAQFLTPPDFGMVAVATLAITFMQMIWEGGLGRALVQIDREYRRAANVVFWTNMGLALGAFILLQFAASQIAGMMGVPAAAPVLRVLGLQIVINAIGAVQQSLATRALDFKRLFWIRLTTSVAPGLFSIPLALFGWGVWALVIGNLIGQTLAVALLWIGSRWRPTFEYDSVLAKRLLGFGIWVALESMGGWLLNWGDNLVVGKNLGTHELGVYRTGGALVTVVFATLLSPVFPIAYPTFCRLQDNPLQLKETFRKYNTILIIAAIAIGAGVFSVGPAIARAMFNDKWVGLGHVISTLALMNGIAWTVGLNAELYRAMGRPEINTKLMYIQLLFYMPAYWFGSRYGLEIFCLIRAGVAAISMPLHIYFASRVLNLEMTYIWSIAKRPLFAALAMGLVVWFAEHQGRTPWAILDLTLQVCFGAIVFLACMWIMDRSVFSEFKILFRKKGVAK